MTDPSGLGSGARLTFHGWEQFESGLAAGAEEWLLTNPDHPEAEQVQERLDRHRLFWLRGRRDVMGFVYLTLGVSLS